MNWRVVMNINVGALLTSWFYYFRNRSTPYRDALFYLMLTTVFSLLPLIAGGLMLWLFHKWNGDWKELLQGGDLLVASACLMASSLWTLRRGGCKRRLKSAAGSCV